MLCFSLFKVYFFFRILVAANPLAAHYLMETKQSFFQEKNVDLYHPTVNFFLNT